MNKKETERLMISLRAVGWSEKDINDFILWVKTGEGQYKPMPSAKQQPGGCHDSFKH